MSYFLTDVQFIHSRDDSETRQKLDRCKRGNGVLRAGTVRDYPLE